MAANARAALDGSGTTVMTRIWSNTFSTSNVMISVRGVVVCRIADDDLVVPLGRIGGRAARRQASRIDRARRAEDRIAVVEQTGRSG